MSAGEHSLSYTSEESQCLRRKGCLGRAGWRCFAARTDNTWSPGALFSLSLSAGLFHGVPPLPIMTPVLSSPPLHQVPERIGI